MNIYQVIKKPVITEKSHELASADKYVFQVDPAATKQDVARAIEALYKNVEVDKVAITKLRGKTVRLRRRGARAVEGKRQDTKRAIVTLSKGKIDIFEKK
ncbi:50S ribosomal protein L23 [Candidatus Saccharibacteria bacterium]|nr:50S ribosomal protein L23 [Candidatus Saccharibacteria bacterium]